MRKLGVVHSMEISTLFPSDNSRKALLAAQKLVAERVSVKDEFNELRLIAGVDQAFIEDIVISGIVVLRYGSLEVIEKVHAIQPASYPYIPTFLSFREGRAILCAYRRLKNLPDILMVDGAGVNHPRKAGMASHIGVALDTPTIGITKRILCGSGEEPLKVGEATPLFYKNIPVAWLLKSSKRSRPIVIAPGHKVSLETSLSITKQCIRNHKLPEPLRLAHMYVNEVKKQL